MANTVATFHVFHAKQFALVNVFPDDFQAVAVVHARELGEVFELTNHIDSDWTKNSAVGLRRSGPQRSTSVGDVIREVGGDFHVVKGIGFESFQLDEDFKFEVRRG